MASKVSEVDGYIDSPNRIAELAGSRALALRLSLNRSRQSIAVAAGVGLMTLRRFELTGHATFEAVVRIAIALGDDRAIDQFFRPRDFRTLDGVIAAQTRGNRKRAAGPRPKRKRQ
jgi:transcriptional regulator with XRE-family HTH domain